MQIRCIGEVVPMRKVLRGRCSEELRRTVRATVEPGQLSHAVGAAAAYSPLLLSALLCITTVLGRKLRVAENGKCVDARTVAQIGFRFQA